MSAEKVARLIADFDQPETTKPRSRVVPFDQLHHTGSKPQLETQLQPIVAPRSPQSTTLQPAHVQQKAAAALEEEAYARGSEEGYARAKAEFTEKLEQEKQALEAKAADDRQVLLNETAAKIAADIAEVGDQLQSRIADVAARILEPMISSAVQKQAAASFIDHLAAITTDARRPVLRITGPSELLELIRSKLGVRAIAVEMRPGPEIEASITIDQIVLETQLKAWTDRLKLAIQG